MFFFLLIPKNGIRHQRCQWKTRCIEFTYVWLWGVICLFPSVELEAHIYRWTFNKQLILGGGGGFNYIWFALIYLPFQAKCSSWKTVSYQRYLKHRHPLQWHHLLFPLSVTDWIRRWVCLWKCQSCVHLTAWYRLTVTGKNQTVESQTCSTFNKWISQAFTCILPLYHWWANSVLEGCILPGRNSFPR